MAVEWGCQEGIEECREAIKLLVSKSKNPNVADEVSGRVLKMLENHLVPEVVHSDYRFIVMANRNGWGLVVCLKYILSSRRLCVFVSQRNAG